MADNIPAVPSGAMPPKKETGKVQPKKETVRINLPPKPSAAPTIKMPTLPPGGAVAGATAPATGGRVSPTASTAPPSRAAAAPVAAPKPGVAQHHVAAAPGMTTVSSVDKMLAIAVAVVALIAAAIVGLLGFTNVLTSAGL